MDTHTTPTAKIHLLSLMFDTWHIPLGTGPISKFKFLIYEKGTFKFENSNLRGERLRFAFTNDRRKLITGSLLLKGTTRRQFNNHRHNIVWLWLCLRVRVPGVMFFLCLAMYYLARQQHSLDLKKSTFSHFLWNWKLMMDVHKSVSFWHKKEIK